MPTPTRHLALLGVLLLPLALVACDSEDTDDFDDVVALLEDDDDFTALSTALAAADLNDDLQGDGPFTVFAPTDAAFNAALDSLGLSSLDELLERDDLDDILLFHVADEEFTADDLDDGTSLTTLGGEELEIVEADGDLFIDTDHDGEGDAEVVETNIEAGNGIVHRIDAVLLPHAH